MKFENPEIKIGFSSFATLRPAHCVLAGTGGTHSVCVYEFPDLHFPNIRKCIYFSDGGPQQLKNLDYFANIYFHDQDFHRSADWNFQATADGKGLLCDGVGGALKRLARRASLQMSSNDQISTALELFNWLRRDSSLNKYYCFVQRYSYQKYNNKNKLLETRFENCRAIPGTQKLHRIKPGRNYELNVKNYSTTNKNEVFCFSKSKGKKQRKQQIKK